MLRRMLLILVGLTLSACGQATSIPTALPSQTPTLTVAPSGTPSPTSTPTTTPTPLPTLGSGPYLMLQSDRDNQQKLMIYDANGAGRKLIKLPDDSHTDYYLDNAISPNGQWLAFYTGSFLTHLSAEETRPEQLPITLHLLNLSDGTTRKVADVVTDGYEAKLEQLTEKLQKNNPKDDEAIDPYLFKQSVDTSSVWSPDSHKLAFAAQINGLSSDIYVYDLDTGQIQQVEESSQSALMIRWSPDGKYIIFKNSVSYSPDGATTSLRAVKIGKQVVKEPKILYSSWFLSSGAWISPQTLLLLDGSDTAGNFNLRKLNVETGQITDLWLGAVSEYAVDDKNQLIVINTGEFAKLEKRGVYFLSYSGKSVKVLDGIYYLSLFFRGGTKHRFIGVGIGGKTTGYEVEGIFGLPFDGKEPTSLKHHFDYQHISISPDHAWMLLFDETSLYLYNKNDELVKTFPIAGINKIIWRPDSQAIFYSTNNQLYSLTIPLGAPKLVDQCDLTYCSFDLENAVWLP